MEAQKKGAANDPALAAKAATAFPRGRALLIKTDNPTAGTKAAPARLASANSKKTFSSAKSAIEAPNPLNKSTVLVRQQIAEATLISDEEVKKAAKSALHKQALVPEEISKSVIMLAVQGGTYFTEDPEDKVEGA